MSPPAPFSFHCVICFESFDHDVRFPVVLPCGHTYLCQPCSKRLTRCMECRTSLFLPSNRSRGGMTAGGTSPGPRTPKQLGSKQFEESIPLPLPKNLLLLTLMEVAERETRAKHIMMPTSRESSKSDSLRCSASGDDSSEDNDDDKVWAGIASVNSSCGTYAVAEKTGLVIVPKKRANAKYGDKCHHVGDLTDHVLNHGDRIQVVSFSDGCATLARGRGLVYAKASQLVKVEGAQDKACQIEGILLELSNRKRELSEEQDELNLVERGLQKALKGAMLTEYEVIITPTSPVPSRDSTNNQKPASNNRKLLALVSSTASNNASSPTRQLDVATISPSSQGPAILVPVSASLSPSLRSPPSIRAGTRFRTKEASSGHPSTGSSTLTTEHVAGGANDQSAASPKLTQWLTSFSSPHDFGMNEGGAEGDVEPVYACGGGAMFNLWDEEGEDFCEVDANETSDRLLPPMPMTYEGTIEIGNDGGESAPLLVDVMRPTRTDAMVESNTIVNLGKKTNFRTGLSGHRALGSNKVPDHDGHKCEIRMMGDHRGIARVGRLRNREEPGSSPTSLNTPLSW